MKPSSYNFHFATIDGLLLIKNTRNTAVFSGQKHFTVSWVSMPTYRSKVANVYHKIIEQAFLIDSKRSKVSFENEENSNSVVNLAQADASFVPHLEGVFSLFRMDGEHSTLFNMLIVDSNSYIFLFLPNTHTFGFQSILYVRECIMNLTYNTLMEAILNSRVLPKPIVFGKSTKLLKHQSRNTRKSQFFTLILHLLCKVGLDNNLFGLMYNFCIVRFLVVSLAHKSVFSYEAIVYLLLFYLIKHHSLPCKLGRKQNKLKNECALLEDSAKQICKSEMISSLLKDHELELMSNTLNTACNQGAGYKVGKDNYEVVNENQQGHACEDKKCTINLCKPNRYLELCNTGYVKTQSKRLKTIFWILKPAFISSRSIALLKKLNYVNKLNLMLFNRIKTAIILPFFILNHLYCLDLNFKPIFYLQMYNQTTTWIYDLEEDKLVKEKVYKSVYFFFKYIFHLIKHTSFYPRVMTYMSYKVGVKFDDLSSIGEIEKFVRYFDINLEECKKKTFVNFNDFFYRELKENSRLLEVLDGLIAPADCRMLVFKNEEEAKNIWIKGKKFNINDLCGNSESACEKGFSCEVEFYERYNSILQKEENLRFEDEVREMSHNFLNLYQHTNATLCAETRNTRKGVLNSTGGQLFKSIVLCRLAPQDYHRFHAPFDGVIVSITDLGKDYYPVHPIAVKSIDVFTLNVRKVVTIQSEKFGLAKFIAIGAALVGSVVIVKSVNDKISVMDELGYFKFGGSSVILLLENEIEFDERIRNYSLKGIETYVKVGKCIGNIGDPQS